MKSSALRKCIILGDRSSHFPRGELAQGGRRPSYFVHSGPVSPPVYALTQSRTRARSALSRLHTLVTTPFLGRAGVRQRVRNTINHGSGGGGLSTAVAEHCCGCNTIQQTSTGTSAPVRRFAIDEATKQNDAPHPHTTTNPLRSGVCYMYTLVLLY